MSDIQNYFKNSTVFITGGTGFLGSLLIEKLLRTCKDLKQIYVLIRPKKNVTEKERFETFFDAPIFDKLKEENPEFLKKVVLMPGDITIPKLGLSDENIEILNAEVNCIFHSAANVKFVEKLRNSFNSNVGAVQELIKIAKNIRNLTSLVYVSTLFTCNISELKEVGESFYDSVPFTFQQFEALLHHFDDELIEKIKPVILQKCPNIYILNKSIAQEVLRENGKGLPIAIVKPSMVTSTYSDPFPGWIDNYYGIITVFLSTVTGFMRVLLCHSKYAVDFVPADYVVNLLIASAWDISNLQNNRKIEDGSEQESTIKIYNCVNSSQNPITWERSINLMRKHYYNSPYNKAAKNIFFMTTNTYVYNFLRYAVCMFPAYVNDFLRFSTFTSKSIKSSQIYRQQFQILDKAQIAMLADLNIHDNNTQNLWKKLNLQDRVTYIFNFSGINWNTYCKILVNGIRTYLLKNKL